MTASKILFFLCLSFVAGIFLNSIYKMPQFLIWGILVVSFLIIIAFLTAEKDFFVIAGFCVIFLVLGVLRMQISEFNIANDGLRKFNGSKISLSGVILSESDLRDKSQKLKVQVDNLGSTVLVTTNRYPEYRYLDKIKLIGELKEPSVTDEFNYKNYLMKDGIYSVMDFPKISAQGGESPDFLQKFYSGVLFFKQKIREGIRSNFSPPESSILEGTVLGDNGAMSADLKDKLNTTGLRHIIAVSGTHVVILSSIIMSLLIAIGLRRGKAFYFAIVFIFLYILLTGFPASGIRAGIMGGLYLLAQKLGRQSMGSRVIAMAGAVMLFINPLLLFYDVGFQLSFLAVMGLIYLEPFIREFFKFAIKRIFKVETKERPESVLKMLSTTFAAQVFTLPIMVFNFGNISFVSPITNLLISPIVEPLMILGFLSSFAGAFLPFLAWILSLPCYFLLLYFVWVIDFFSQPWAMGVVKNVSWVWLFASYIFIVVLIKFLNSRYSRFVV